MNERQRRAPRRRAWAWACAWAIAAASLHPAAAQAQTPTIRIGYLEAMSGPFASAGTTALKHFQMVIDDINQRGLAGPYRIELKVYDNKGTPQESLSMFKAATDAGLQVLTNSQSATLLALMDAIGKHNARHPEQRVMMLNPSGGDPALTNANCSFFHFAFDANVEMKMEGLTTMIQADPSIKKVYLINQNYSQGMQVSQTAKEYLARKRPDIAIVGDDLHPLIQVKDFSPYVAKIKASGADTVITGSWGTDLTLLIRAAKEGGLKTKFYTFYAGALGAPVAMGDSAVGAVRQITEWHRNLVPNNAAKWADDYARRFDADFYALRINNMMYMFAEAVRRANSDDPLRISYALEGMKWTGPTGDLEMRGSDHQIQQPLYISTVRHIASRGGPKDVVHDSDKSGYGFSTDMRIEPYVAARPTTCRMERPPRPAAP
ncbi:branched-chain amino acid ABC transporter substrate-binding protein [Variovorax sp. PDNC026]|uniref:branched-chain amino acid ABC transporter substrate-binding protein n=1 Tax=Variovorax sp. PDNC026 TaxID=2811425 RepID=UPI001966C0E9|nr:branched-chain amino acid ABC transporter substrate-binding protein [Variovorax sp. PDNC026]QRY31848.1 branched-chain amino acid ABC transporter substrate-binding protein [Variovorax sp. PDNC026]